MAMRALVLIMCAIGLVQPRIARAQSVAAEAALTGGLSTDEVSAAAAQVRVFGDATNGIRFFGEAAWAGRSLSEGDHETDSFNAAYPYINRVQIIEAYGERIFRPQTRLVGIRAGRFRTPFGIYNASDHAYFGFLRAPLVRYEEYSPLSNNFLEHGADLVAGVPQLTVEAALGAPADVGETTRRSGLDAVFRVQGYYGALIAGVSHMQTPNSQLALDASGRTSVTGIDLRWMHAGVQLRGEWLTGRPSGEPSATGWYADALIHRARMGPVTAVVRIERLDWTDAHSGDEEHLSRQTVGARIRLTNALALHVNALHETGDDEYLPRALDVALTWSVRTP
jgi:hypothetical protein